MPLGLEAIERAIELNGVAVETNKRAFAWGRLAAHDLAQVEVLVRATRPDRDAARARKAWTSLVERRAAFLTDYQDAAYAQRYRDLVEAIAAAERSRARGRSELAEAVARNLFKLMAYKDEYEVARLYTDGAFLKKLQRQFEGDFKLAVPSGAAAAGAARSGHRRAREARVRPVDDAGVPAAGAAAPAARHGVRHFRLHRGAPHGAAADRASTRRSCASWPRCSSPDNHALAVEIASLPEPIRGFGHIKRRNADKAKAREAELLDMLRSRGAAATAA